MESIREWVTLVSAVVAAIAACCSLYWQIGERGDRIHVDFGPITTTMTDYTVLYVVNIGKHEIVLQDYGFVLSNSRLLSIPAESLDRAYSGKKIELDVFEAKETRLLPRGHTEAGAQIPGTVSGVWAQSITQARPVIRFASSVGFEDRLRIRFLAWRSGWKRA